MAKIADLQHIIYETNANIKQPAIEIIAQKTRNNFNFDWVISELKLKEKVTPKTIIKTINEAPREKLDACGFCVNRFISVLDRSTLKEIDETSIIYPILLPKAKAHCPNCGREKEKTPAIIYLYTKNELGWLFVILYDFVIHRLNLKIPYLQFRTMDIWKDIDIYPELSLLQQKIIEMIQENARIEKITNLAPIQQKITDTVNAVKL
jgi:hypothetical protein